MCAYKRLPGRERHLESMHGTSDALGQVSAGRASGLEGSPKSPLGHLEICQRKCLLQCCSWHECGHKPRVVSILIFGKLILRGKVGICGSSMLLMLYQSLDGMWEGRWGCGLLWFPLVCRLITVHSLWYPFQQGYGGNSEKIDSNSQDKGMTEKTNSARDSLVNGERARKSWVG